MILIPFYSHAQLTEHSIRFASVESAAAPQLDGRIQPDEWQHATRLENFVLTNGSGAPSLATDLMLSYDQENLYLAVIAMESEPEKMIRKANLFDDQQVLYDDRVEIFIDANHDHRTYYHFAVNPEGVRLDQEILHWLPLTRTHHPDKDWNGFWITRTRIEQDRWVVEVSIRWETLGITNPEPGTTLGFNVGRARRPQVNVSNLERNHRAREGEEYTAWSHTNDGIWETPSNFFEPLHFGDLVLGNPGFQVNQINFPNLSFNGNRGNPSMFGENPLELVFDRPLAGNLTMEVNVWVPEDGVIFKPGSLSKLASQKTFEPGSVSSAQFSGSFFINQDQENRLEIVIRNAAGKSLYHTSYLLMVPPFIRFNLEALYTGNTGVDPVAFTLDMDNELRRNVSAILTFSNQGGKRIDEVTIEKMPANGEFLPVFNASKLANLPGGNYTIYSKATDKRSGKVLGAYVQDFTLPSLDSLPVFAVNDHTYNYGGVSAPGVVVDFPCGGKFVFWQAASYIPWWDLKQLAVSNEFVESWSQGMEGCAEPMQDRECRYSSVKILEDNVVRKRILWRYALNDAHYRIFANEWVEEIFTFYPDGTGTREVKLWANTSVDHEVFEAIFVNPPGVNTYQLFDPQIVSLKNLSGQQYNLLQFDQDPALHQQFVHQNESLILENHLKNRLHPFTVFYRTPEILPGVEADQISVARKKVAQDTRRGHWPASEYPVDGYNVAGDAVPGHFSLGNIHMMTDKNQVPNRWLFLIGVKEEGADFDLKVANNWINPPEATTGSSTGISYDRSQRAYVVHGEPTNGKIPITCDGNLVNPVWIMKNISGVQKIQLNKEQLSKEAYQVSITDQGIMIFIDKIIEAGDKLIFYCK